MAMCLYAGTVSPTEGNKAMTTHHRDGYLIHTDGWAKPIPDRNNDWCATLDSYEPGMPCGWGSTEEKAIQDLLELIRSEEEL
jgi:hypothetical protein